jgi:hypothetical protein
MDPLDEMVARICASIDRIGETLTREADEMRALSLDVGQAIEARTAALEQEAAA